MSSSVDPAHLLSQRAQVGTRRAIFCLAYVASHLLKGGHNQLANSRISAVSGSSLSGFCPTIPSIPEGGAGGKASGTSSAPRAIYQRRTIRWIYTYTTARAKRTKIDDDTAHSFRRRMGCAASSEAASSAQLPAEVSAAPPKPKPEATRSPFDPPPASTSKADSKGPAAGADPAKPKLRPEVVDVTRDATDSQKDAWWSCWKGKWDARMEEEYHYSWSESAAAKNHALQEQGLILGMRLRASC